MLKAARMRKQRATKKKTTRERLHKKKLRRERQSAYDDNRPSKKK